MQQPQSDPNEHWHKTTIDYVRRSVRRARRLDWVPVFGFVVTTFTFYRYSGTDSQTQPTEGDPWIGYVLMSVIGWTLSWFVRRNLLGFNRREIQYTAPTDWIQFVVDRHLLQELFANGVLLCIASSCIYEYFQRDRTLLLLLVIVNILHIVFIHSRTDTVLSILALELPHLRTKTSL